MFDSMRRRAAAAFAALVLAVLAVTVTAAPASASAPVPGTDACTEVVDLDQAVVAARVALAAAPTDLPVADLDELKASVDAAVQDATVRLCTGDDTPTTPPTSTSTPAPSTSPNGDERDCNDFDSRADAQAFYDSVTTPANPDPSRLDRDGDGRACEPSEGPASSSSGGVDPTADDGSTATTGGSQVVDVPEGSASTGGGV